MSNDQTGNPNQVRRMNDENGSVVGQWCFHYSLGFLVWSFGFVLGVCGVANAQTTQPLVIHGDTIYTMDGSAPVKDGYIVLRNGTIESVGAAVPAPAESVRTIRAKVVTPGLIDAHTIVGLQGYLNEPREQDQLEKSAPVQPELRALDAFNGREKLLEWVRGFGVTTIHTGPEPGELMPGQTMI